jgi:hypothetical protein
MAVKTIVIQGYAVGMHHYGRKELHVGVGYKLKREPENKGTMESSEKTANPRLTHALVSSASCTLWTS